MRLLVITLEYDAFPFSGNGVYAQSLVRGLLQQDDVIVDVVCGSPEHDEEACDSRALVKIQLPRWCSLDGACSHREFRDEAIKRLDALYGGGHIGNQILRRVRAESSRRPPRHRRDACSMAWRYRFLTARPSQDGRVIAEK